MEQDQSDERTSLLLHPNLPPLQRPQPPLSALHYFAKETEEERRLRRELGYTSFEDDTLAREEGGDNDMQIDETIIQPSITQSVHQQRTSVVQQITAATVPTSLPPPVALPPVAAQSIQPIQAKEATSSRIVEQSVPEPEASAASEKPSGLAEGSFISMPSDKGKSREVEQTLEEITTFTSNTIEDDDEPIPELDSGSSDEGEEDDDDIEDD